MSDWDNWVNFVSGHAYNDYYTNGPAESPSVWHLLIGGFDGSVYAKSENFDATFDSTEMLKMANAANGDQTDIFTVPPKGYTIVRLVPASADINVLTGKKKGDSGRLIYAARCSTTLVVALVDVTSCSRGAESKALDAFSVGIQEGINAGI